VAKVTWLVEVGIGEERAVRIEHGDIAEARVRWPGELEAGLVADAVLVSRARGSIRGTVRFADGQVALVDRLPANAVEGAALRVEVTRPAFAESGRRKLAHARPSEAAARPAPPLAEALEAQGHGVGVVRRFPEGDWDGLVAEAFAAEVAFAGGGLHFSPTPAMLLVDIDGGLDPRPLALAAVTPLARALRRFDLGGSIGIDFPTLAAKIDRREIDAALEQALSGWPHERTAMNGFGFVQLVARLQRLSLLHRAAFQRAEIAARLLLRKAEALEGAGAVLLSAHPAIEPALRPEWLMELARRTGREVRFEARPALAIEAPQAQLVPR
jgi:ribonuclease G